MSSPKPSPAPPTRRRWFLAGLSRGAVAGLLTATLIGVADAYLAMSADDLGGGGLFRVWLYATGLLGVLLVPWGAFVGVAIAAAKAGRELSTGDWLRALAEDEARDVTWTSAVLAVVVAVGSGALAAGLFHAALLHDLNNKTLASAFAVIVNGGGLVAATATGVIVFRLAPPWVSRLPLASLGRPWGARLAGLVYLLLGVALVAGALGFAKFYDPAVWPPAYIAELGLALAGPAVLFVLLGRAGPATRVVDAAPTVAVALVGVLAIAWVPVTQFEPDDPVRIAAFEDTQLMRRALGFYSALGDRDGDGFAAILGGPDCDDADATVNPSAYDVPGNGVDENCVGGDAKVVERVKRSTIPGRVIRAAERALVTSATAAGGSQSVVPPKPVVDLQGMNVVLIQVDTIRVDHLGHMGYERETSPEIDAIAAKSVVFTHAHTQAPNTPRAMPSIFTSRYPAEIPFKNRAWNFSPVKDKALTVYEVLAEQGYVNHSLTSHWYFQERRNLQQGFARWDNAGWVDIAPSNTDISAPRIYDRLEGHLDALEGSEKPWTLFIHFADPHGRYMVHKGDDIPRWGTELVDKYDGEIRYADGYVGKVWRDLEARGLLDKTVFILTSDHGEAFGEHGHHFHGQTIYQEILRVPLIMYVPGIPPSRVETPVELVDIAPTILDGAGIAIPDAFSGRSLVPALEDPSAMQARHIYAEHLRCKSWDQELRALILGDWKIVWRVTEGFYELYNLASDPGEKKNLWRKEREKAAEMRTAITEFVEQKLQRP